MNWFDLPFFSSPQWRKLRSFLDNRRKQVNIFPPDDKLFEAFRLTPREHVKVVILGQDPYHRPEQSHGLCFSVPNATRNPPSLRNILKEAARDIGNPSIVERSSNLSDWAEQGVLLLNTCLSVEEGKPTSHRNMGWEKLIIEAINAINSELPHVVFLLWGKPAQSYSGMIADRHTILKAPHPSPLSAFRGFHGCSHFSETNLALKSHGQTPIIWG